PRPRRPPDPLGHVLPPAQAGYPSPSPPVPYHLDPCHRVPYHQDPCRLGQETFRPVPWRHRVRRVHPGTLDCLAPLGLRKRTRTSYPGTRSIPWPTRERRPATPCSRRAHRPEFLSPDRERMWPHLSRSGPRLRYSDQPPVSCL